MQITVKIEVEPQMIADMIVTAFEAGHYGCRYWMPKARPPKGFRHSKDCCNWYMDPRLWTPGRDYVVRFWEDTEDNGEAGKLIAFRVDDLPNVLQRIAKDHPAKFARFLETKGDDGEPFDGPAADEFLQLMLLGEVRYG